jgi:alpha-D-ribose 1-methylphosphonate 5-triphosphate diphosphatase
MRDIHNNLDIVGGAVLGRAGFLHCSVGIKNGMISTPGLASVPQFNARGLLVLPGIIDIHGDAFERQIMPRPGVAFPLDVALLDSDRQVVSNGITTVYHGVTWSWEPGLRGADNARELLETLEGLRCSLQADTRYHLRHETYNLDGEPEILEWIAGGRIGALAFNDHMSSIAQKVDKPHLLAKMVERSGLAHDDFITLTKSVEKRGAEVQGSIARLAAAALASGIPTLSHDDRTPDERRNFRAMGARIAEFPVTEETARAAVAAGEWTVYGAPNVVRGGSHTGWTSASEMARKGLCKILASDYYYPALPLAPFRLAHDGVMPLEQAWALVSENPSKAMGLDDRGVIAEGKRADIVCVDASDALRPRIVATLVAGKMVFLAEAARLH